MEIFQTYQDSRGVVPLPHVPATFPCCIQSVTFPFDMILRYAPWFLRKVRNTFLRVSSHDLLKCLSNCLEYNVNRARNINNRSSSFRRFKWISANYFHSCNYSITQNNRGQSPKKYFFQYKPTFTLTFLCVKL